MEEKDYWVSLEFRICSELGRRPEKDLRAIWCDGIGPGQYHAEGRPRIEGVALMGVGGNDRWEFTLFVGRRVPSAADLDWAKLLPPEETSGCLSIDPERRTVTIDPASRRLPIRAPSQHPER